MAFTSPTRVSASSSVAKTWRTQPSASLARSSHVGVAQALVRLGVPDQQGHAGESDATAASATARTRAAPPRAMSRHQKPFAVAVARHALLVCAWPPMDGAFLGLAPTHIPCATLMNANFKSIQVQTYSDPTHSVHKVVITRAWTPLPRS